MNATFFKINKRINSTKQPLPSTGHQVDIQVKDECSFINPVFKISPAIVSGTFSPNVYNYVSVPYWQRYYYITDWKYLNGVWECSCTVDVLASFRAEIGATSSYIIRANSAYNGDIVDSFYPTTSVCAITKQQISSDIYHTTIPGGCFVVGIINKSNSNLKMGAVIYYALTAQDMGNLMNYLFSSSIYQQAGISAAEITDGLYQSLFNPFQYFVSCMWFPYAANVLGDTTETITVGFWNTNITGTIVRYVVKEVGFKTNLPIPRHPQIARGAYLDHAPYTKLTAYYPPFGEVPIDTTFMQYGSNNYLYGTMYIDHITGLADCYFTITDGYDTDTTADKYKYMTMRSAQVGVPIQLSQVLTDYVSTLQSGVGAVSSLFTGNIAGIFGNIISGVQNSMPKVSSMGANGSLIEILTPPYLIVEHMQVVDENQTEFGRPLCATETISNLSGFIQCGEADHSFSGTKAENEEINRYMREGFFYE